MKIVLRLGFLTLLSFIGVLHFYLDYQDLPEDSVLSINEAWPEGSNLNISHYLQVNPQFLAFPRLKLPDAQALILVHSAPKNEPIRQLIRDTWAQTKLLVKYQIEVAFVIGQDPRVAQEIEEYQDILMVNLHDSYMNLTLKSAFMIKYLHDIHGTNKKLKMVLKTDDDCYVNIPAFAHLIKQNQAANAITGAILNSKEGKNRHPVNRDEGDKWSIPTWMFKGDHFPTSVSGSGYLFPISMSHCLYKSSQKIPLVALEDVYITGLLAHYCKFTHKNSVHFHYMGPPDDYCLLDPAKVVVIHRVNIEKMHKRIHGIKEMNEDRVFTELCSDFLTVLKRR